MTTAVQQQPGAPMPHPAPVPIAAAPPAGSVPSASPRQHPQHQQHRQRPGKENLSQPAASSKHRSAPSGQTNTGGATGSSNNGRNRRDRPCDACRRRKSRCVMHEGALLCVLCEFHKQECTFLQSPQPRKRKLNGENKKDDASGSRKRLSFTDTPSVVIQKSDSNRLASSTSTPLPSINKFPAGSETLGLHRGKRSTYIGLTTPFDPILISLTQFDTRHESIIDLGTLRRVNDHECFIMLPDEALQEYGEDAEALRAIDQAVAPYGDALIDVFFRTVHPSFPVVQKRIFYERLRNNDRTFSPPLLAGMYILALNWWAHEPNLAPNPKPDVDRLEEIATVSLNAAIKRPKLSTVQAGLLLLQRPEADSWSLTTQLVAVGQELGLHLDCSTWSIPSWERGLRKRIAWALYMQDKWSSLIHGRPSHIFSANWAVKSIADGDFQENEEGSPDPVAESQTPDDHAENEKGQTLFSQMITLTEIMAEIMDTFYTQVAIEEFKAAGTGSTRLILDRAKPVQIKLKDWYSALPHSIRMDNVQDHRLSPTGYLHLAYYATEITLHRRIVQSLSPSSADAYLQYICRSAAKTRLISALDFVNRLKPEHLQAFWYYASKVNFTLIGTFGSLLWATAPAREEAGFYKARLTEYRWTLSVSSRKAEFLEYAVQMLDASRAMLGNLEDKPSLKDVLESGAAPESATKSRRDGTTRKVGWADDDGRMNLDAGSSSRMEIDEDMDKDDVE